MDQYSKFSVDVGGGKRENVSYKEEIINEAFSWERGGGRCMYVSMYATMDVVYKAFI